MPLKALGAKPTLGTLTIKNITRAFRRALAVLALEAEH
jgi:hypothetical protein